MKLKRPDPESISQLRRELQQVRRESLLATRHGDFIKVARLTSRAATLNREISEAEGMLLVQ